MIRKRGMADMSFREAMAEALYDEAARNPNLMVLTPDLARALRLERIVSGLPNQYLSLGIAELNATGVAAGLASVGREPVIAGFAMFSAVRPFEQLRNMVAYPDLNVKIIATHGGLCVGKDGATHQALEDLALMRTLPNFTVLTACDARQTKAAVHAMLKKTGPAYLRLGRDGHGTVYETDPEYMVGGSDVLRDGDDLAIFTYGSIAGVALQAAKRLERHGISAAVINTYSIKPLDKVRVLQYAQKCHRVLTVEDHFKAGGLGSMIAELLSSAYPAPMDYIGVDDIFGESGGEAELYHKYGLDEEAVVGKAIALCGKKEAAG